jgi:hypothetical protein
LFSGLLNQYLSQEEDGEEEGDGASQMSDDCSVPTNANLEMDDDKEDEEEDEEDEEKKKNEALLLNCFSAIVNTLSTANPRQALNTRNWMN